VTSEHAAGHACVVVIDTRPPVVRCFHLGSGTHGPRTVPAEVKSPHGLCGMNKNKKRAGSGQVHEGYPIAAVLQRRFAEGGDGRLLAQVFVNRFAERPCAFAMEDFHLG